VNSGQFGYGQVIQNVPGQIYNSESGFIPNIAGGTAGLSNGGTTAGLADYGTRLKAVFSSVPAGVRIFVSITNIGNETSANATTANTSFAELINGEVSPDSNGYPPLLSATTNVVCTSSTSCSTSSPIMGLYDITSGGATAGGTYSAVWEVINTNPSQNENFNFAVFTVYTPNAGSNLPPPGTANVNQLCSDCDARRVHGQRGLCRLQQPDNPTVCGYLDGKGCPHDQHLPDPVALPVRNQPERF